MPHSHGEVVNRPPETIKKGKDIIHGIGNEPVSPIHPTYYSARELTGTSSHHTSTGQIRLLPSQSPRRAPGFQA